MALDSSRHSMKEPNLPGEHVGRERLPATWSPVRGDKVGWAE